MENKITLINGIAVLDHKVIKSLKEFESQIKILKEAQDSYKQSIKEEMEQKNIMKIHDEVEGVTITYTEAKDDIEVFNKDRLRDENPDLYDQYITMDGKKSSYISIRIK